MRILFYISTICGGGAARVMVNLANELSQKYDVYLVVNYEDQNDYKVCNNVRRINLEKREKASSCFVVRNLFRILKLRKVVKDNRIDIGISFMLHNNIRMIISCMGLDIRRYVSVRNDPNMKYKGIVKCLAKFLYGKVDGVVFQTEDAQNFFGKSIKKKSEIIMNQVDERFYFSSDNVGGKIIACGRLSKQKNYDLLLKAFRRVVSEFPSQELYIYGEGELKKILIDKTKELEINNNVHFMGYCKNMEDVYKTAKFVVLSSDYEGMPNVLLEAMASSVPVISTDCPIGGPAMIIENGINGLLVPIGDECELSGAMIKMLKNEEMIKTMKKNAYGKAQEFAPEIILKKWEEFIIRCNS